MSNQVNPFALALDYILRPEDINSQGQCINSARKDAYLSIAGAMFKVETLKLVPAEDMIIVHEMIEVVRVKKTMDESVCRIEMQRSRVETLRLLAIAWRN